MVDELRIVDEIPTSYGTSPPGFEGRWAGVPKPSWRSWVVLVVREFKIREYECVADKPARFNRVASYVCVQDQWIDFVDRERG